VKAFGGTVDVADRQSLRGWVEEVAGLLGGLDIFVAKVSALERAWAMDEESWRLGLEIDVMGTVAGSRRRSRIWRNPATGRSS